MHLKKILTVDDFQLRNMCFKACIRGCFNIIKYFHKVIGLSKENFLSCDTHIYACTYGKLNIVKYLHKEIGFVKEDFESKK